MTNAHNLNSHLLGTGEFSFAEGAATLTAARAIGFRDFGNMLTYSVQPTNTKVEHKGSYRGTKRTDKTRITEAKILYQLKMDEWTMQNLLYIYYGDTAGQLTQSIKTAVAGDALDFTSVFNLGYWYDLTVSGVRIRNLTTARLALQNVGIAVAGTQTDDLFTKTTHGLVNGKQIIFTNAGGATEFVINTPYYIVTSTTNTFQISATLGGSPITFAADTSGALYEQVLISGIDYELDLVLGRVRFTTAQTGKTVYATVTAPAITATDPGALRLITPLVTTKRSGIGRLVIFDDKINDQVATEHDGFGCDISLTGNVDGGADTFSDFTLEVLITDPLGLVGVREAAAGTT